MTMSNVLNHLVPRWRTLRAALALGGYATLLYGVLVLLCLMPGQALAGTGYVRVMTLTQYNALLTARASAQTSLVATSIAANSGSVALRMVTGPAGWAALGISAGLTLAQIYYSQSQVQTIVANNTAQGVSIPGFTNYPNMTGGNCDGTYCNGPNPYDQWISIPSGNPNFPQCNPPVPGPPPSGWAGWNTVQQYYGCFAFHQSTSPSTKATFSTQQATGPQIATYLHTLPANDPNALPNNTTPVGYGTSPTPATNTTTDPVDPTQAQTTVVPATQVPGGSVVVDPNAVPPAGTPTTTTTTQTDSTTNTTTTNPDGSTTTQTQTDATVACSTAEHDPRTFGTILQTHLDTWKGSGIAGQLALLQNLTWPSSLPTLSFHSGLLGNFTYDFNEWAGSFLALRAIVIAGAGFAAYRIIFVGGS